MQFNIDAMVKSILYSIHYLGITLLIPLVALAIGIVFGLVIALLRYYQAKVIAPVLQAIVTLFKGIPIVLILLAMYLFCSTAFDPIAQSLHWSIRFKNVNTIWIAIVGLGILAIVNASEIFRGAFASIRQGQLDAAQSIAGSRSRSLAGIGQSTDQPDQSLGIMLHGRRGRHLLRSNHFRAAKLLVLGSLRGRSTHLLGSGRLHRKRHRTRRTQTHQQIGEGGTMMKIRGIRKRFGKQQVLNGVDMDVNDGEVIVILGSSGSGKTTFLRCLNFLEHADEGTIDLNGTHIDAKTAKKRDIIAYQRQTAMVFQNYALFNNKTALENVAMPAIATGKKTKEEAYALAGELVDKVGLAERKDFYPSQLSGGQQQRIGIARALALDPKITLFDEPTSALDPELVGQVLELLRTIANDGATMILVTHEMKFAYEIADRVVFMDKGVVLEQGTPQEIFEHPKEQRTRDFLSRFTSQLSA